MQRTAAQSDSHWARTCDARSPTLRTWPSRVVALLALLALPAHAEPLRFDGTVSFEFAGQGFPPLRIAGSGIATLNGSAGGTHLTRLRLAGGISASAVVPVTDPEATARGIVAARALVTLGTGSLAPFSPTPPGLTQGKLALRGFVGPCLFDPSCLPGGFIPLDLSQGSETAVGVGGSLTAGGAGDVRISVLATPWTLHTALLTVTTPSGASALIPAVGSRHGALSFTTSTAIPGGQLSLVTPVRVTSEAGNALNLFGRLTVRFVPEPGVGLLLGSGCAGIAVLTRARHRVPPRRRT